MNSWNNSFWKPPHNNSYAAECCHSTAQSTPSGTIASTLTGLTRERYWQSVSGGYGYYVEPSRVSFGTGTGSSGHYGDPSDGSFGVGTSGYTSNGQGLHTPLVAQRKIPEHSVGELNSYKTANKSWIGSGDSLSAVTGHSSTNQCRSYGAVPNFWVTNSDYRHDQSGRMVECKSEMCSKYSTDDVHSQSIAVRGSGRITIVPEERGLFGELRGTEPIDREPDGRGFIARDVRGNQCSTLELKDKKLSHEGARRDGHTVRDTDGDGSICQITRAAVSNSDTPYGYREKELCVDPLDIKFTHNTISNTFENGLSLDNAIEDIGRGLDSVSDYPPIITTNRGGDLYTGDNRRLYVFQEAKRRGYIDEIPVTKGCVSPKKWSTKNKGTSVVLRGENSSSDDFGFDPYRFFHPEKFEPFFELASHKCDDDCSHEEPEFHCETDWQHGSNNSHCESSNTHEHSEFDEDQERHCPVERGDQLGCHGDTAYDLPTHQVEDDYDGQYGYHHDVAPREDQWGCHGDVAYGDQQAPRDEDCYDYSGYHQEAAQYDDAGGGDHWDCNEGPEYDSDSDSDY